MNARNRLADAAIRNGWKVSGKTFPGTVVNVEEFVSDAMELLVEVTYSGHTVEAAKLWDFSDKIVTNAPDGVDRQELTAADRGKASRIENVLLGNFRRF